MEAMPTRFRRSSWSCQKASASCRLLDSLPRAGGALLGTVDRKAACLTWMSPEDKNRADDSLAAAFLKEKLEPLGLWRELRVLAEAAGDPQQHCARSWLQIRLFFCHLAAKTGPSSPGNLCCRGLQEAGAPARERF